MHGPEHYQRVALALVMVAFLATCRTEPSRQSPPPRSSVPGSQQPPPSNPLQGCARDLKRRLQPSEIPALLERPNVPELMALGASGTPRRVRLRFNHSAAGCICPSFG